MREHSLVQVLRYKRPCFGIVIAIGKYNGMIQVEFPDMGKVEWYEPSELREVADGTIAI